MTELLATPDAAREFITARRNLLEAMKFDRENGVSANDIARMAVGAISRPVVLRILSVEQQVADARKALRERGLDPHVDVGVAGGSGGWGAAYAYVLNATDFGVFPELKPTLFSDVVAALNSAGLTTGDATEQALWDGERIPIGAR